eukprot:403345437
MNQQQKTKNEKHDDPSQDQVPNYFTIEKEVHNLQNLRRQPLKQNQNNSTLNNDLEQVTNRNIGKNNNIQEYLSGHGNNQNWSTMNKNQVLHGAEYIEANVTNIMNPQHQMKQNPQNNTHQKPSDIDILLNQYDLIKATEEKLKYNRDLINSEKMKDYDLLPAHVKESSVASYYALDPSDDFQQMKREFSVPKSQNQKSQLLIQKPKNFMMKHLDHLYSKSFLIDDLKYMSVDKQKEFDNNKLKNEAKRRLENSISLDKHKEQKYQEVQQGILRDPTVLPYGYKTPQQTSLQNKPDLDSQNYLQNQSHQSAFMRAQQIKSKLDKHIKLKEDQERKQFKLPNMNDIVSRNCNRIVYDGYTDRESLRGQTNVEVYRITRLERLKTKTIIKHETSSRHKIINRIKRQLLKINDIPTSEIFFVFQV